jgi:hypothetical protein
MLARVADLVRPEPAAPAEPTEQRRLRRDEGPTDVATYSCHCGYVFEALVSTTISCPHCGDGQAW